MCNFAPGSVLKPVEGLGEFLAWIDCRKLRKAAVTNAPRANSIAMLEALGLKCASHAMQTLTPSEEVTQVIACCAAGLRVVSG